MELPTQQYLQAMEALIATDGWRLLLEDFHKEIYQAQADALESPNWDTVLKLRGRCEKLNELICLEAFLQEERKAYEGDVHDASV